MRSGNVVWHVTSSGQILFGSKNDERVFSSSGNVVESWNLDGGDPFVYKCDNRVVSNKSSEDGAHVFAADADQCLYCFTKDGTRQWKVKTGCGSALSMAYHNNLIYIVTTQGVLACLDVSKQGTTGETTKKTEDTPVVVEGPKVQEVSVSSTVEKTKKTKGRVLVECVGEGPNLRIKPVSEGYNTDWTVQFPRTIRKKGTRFVVDELVEAVTGGFYRAKGEIHELATATKDFKVFNVNSTASLSKFVQDQGIKYEKGKAYFQFTKEETIQKFKKLVIMDKTTQDIYKGDAVRSLLNLPTDEDVKLSPQTIGRYWVFIQCTSSSRTLQPSTLLLLQSK